MSGIGGIVSAWNTLQSNANCAAQRPDRLGNGASGLLSALQQDSDEAPAGGGTGHCRCACMLNPPNMDALIAAQASVMQFEGSACASMNTFFDTQVQASHDDGTGVAQRLFAMLDADGDGTITRPEFDEALAAMGVLQTAETNAAQTAGESDGGVGATGSPSADGSGAPADGGAGTSTGNSAAPTGNIANSDGDPLSTTSQDDNALAGGSGGQPTQTAATTTTESTSPDGSTTTTITYPDGTTVTLTSPPEPDVASSSNGSSGLALARPPLESALAALIRLQAQMTEAIAA